MNYLDEISIYYLFLIVDDVKLICVLVFLVCFNIEAELQQQLSIVAKSALISLLSSVFQRPRGLGVLRVRM